MIALITGASQGLGLAVATLLDKKQVKLILMARSREKLENHIQQLAFADLHEYFAGDLRDKAYLARCLDDLKARQLIPDLIIHTVGGKVLGDEQPLNPEVLQASVDLNLGIATQINAFFLPLLAERQGGRIIHVSSDASMTGNASPGYVAAKAAINAYVKSTARFYAVHQVMICAVLPGIFEHEKSAWADKKVTQAEYYQARINAMPLKRFASVSEVASVIVDLVYGHNMVYAGSLVELTSGV